MKSASLSRMNNKIDSLKEEMGQAKASKRGGRISESDYDDRSDVDQYHRRIEQLEADLKRRQESYIRRERAYKTRVEELEEELHKMKAGKSSWMQGDSQMQTVRAMHTQILNNVGQVQDRTARILQEQERDLLRAFRARLFDVQTELEKEKNKTDDGASAWIEKSRQLEAEVDWAKEMADRLDRVNQALAKENSRLKTQFKTQEDDREFLIRQLVAMKKDNARLRQEYEKAKSSSSLLKPEGGEEDFGGSSSNPSLPRVPSASGGVTHHSSHSHGGPNQQEADNRYKEIIKRLKRLLEVERRNLRQVRTQFANDLQHRTELELFLKQCIEDVRHEIAANREQAMGGSEPSVDNVSMDDFSPQDRERVMELLLSQERVISLLYSKTFPMQHSEEAPVTATQGEVVEGQQAS